MIFTYSNLNTIPVTQKNNYPIIYVNYLNQKGHVYFKSRLDDFMQEKEHFFLVILFPKDSDMKHLNYISHYIKNYQNNFPSDNLSIHKRIVMIIHQNKYPKNKNYMYNWELDFVTENKNWEFNVIENLNDSFYR